MVSGLRVVQAGGGFGRLPWHNRLNLDDIRRPVERVIHAAATVVWALQSCCCVDGGAVKLC